MFTRNLKKISTPFSFVCNGILLAGIIGMAIWQTDEAPAEKSDPSLTIEDLIERERVPELPAVPPAKTRTAVVEEPQCGGSDVQWLTCAIYFEARSESLEGQYYVARAVMNRVADSRWPDTIEEVVRQGENKRNRCQFSFMCDGKPERIADEDAWYVAQFVAYDVLSQRGEEVASVTCAHSYHASSVKSPRALRWFAKFDRVEKVGTHIFYCDKDLSENPA